MQAQHRGAGRGKMPRQHTGARHIVETKGSITGSSGTVVRGTAEIRTAMEAHIASVAFALWERLRTEVGRGGAHRKSTAGAGNARTQGSSNWCAIATASEMAKNAKGVPHRASIAYF